MHKLIIKRLNINNQIIYFINEQIFKKYWSYIKKIKYTTISQNFLQQISVYVKNVWSYIIWNWIRSVHVNCIKTNYTFKCKC